MQSNNYTVSCLNNIVLEFRMLSSIQIAWILIDALVPVIYLTHKCKDSLIMATYRSGVQ